MIVNRGYLQDAFEVLGDRYPWMEESGQEQTDIATPSGKFYEVYKMTEKGQRWIVRHAFYNSSGTEFVSVEKYFDYPETQV